MGKDIKGAGIQVNSDRDVRELSEDEICCMECFFKYSEPGVILDLRQYRELDFGDENTER